MGAHSVSVIVPVRDAAAILGACLDRLGRQTAVDGVEVIVVDNGSHDDSGLAARSHPAVDQVIHERRRGSYAARNAGIAAARGAVFAFTDADCEPEATWLAEGLAALAAGGDLAAGPVSTIRSPSPSLWERYDEANYLDQAMFVDHGFAATANLFVKRAVVDTIGPFDAALRSGGDVEFSQRAVNAGFELRYAPEAVVRHRPRTTLAETWRLHRRLGAGWRRLAEQGKWPSIWQDPSMRLSLGAAAESIASMGPRIRRRQLVRVHSVVLAARWWGRLSGR